ncbi:hypothetical protein [Salinigranum salinum]|uniref:hypothetical protein n=1 Tax=Salinigranum salinum TaxID=1364937 RepID=UPI0012611968|nr:hypothetical protein [Salinigranum salinum]
MSSPPTLASLLRGRSSADVAAFVAALYAARGAETTVAGDVVIVDDTRYLVVTARQTAVVHRLRRRTTTPRRRIDRVVAVDATRAARIATRYDARPVSAADLDRLARYGLDRATADTLYRDEFGYPLSAVAPVPDSPTTDGRARPSVVGVVTVVAALVLLGTAIAGVGVAAAPLPWAWGAFDDVSVSTPSPLDGGPRAIGTTGLADDDVTETTPPPEPTTPSAREGEQFAPGLSSSGITDVAALAAAHRVALGNGSYHWELDYVEVANGSATASGTETVLVESRRRFVSTVAWTGEPTGSSPVATRSSYADGSVRYRPAANGTGVVIRSLNDFPPAGEQGWRASRYLLWYLSAESSTVERTLVDTGRPTAVVALRGKAYPIAEEYTARAHVTADGFVRSLSVSYVRTGPDTDPVRVRFSFRYDVDPNVSVSSPVWYTADEAHRAG